MTTLETSLPQYRLVIDGRRVEAASGQRYDTVDPYLGAPGPALPTATPRTSTPRWPRPAGHWPGRGASSPGSGGPG